MKKPSQALLIRIFLLGLPIGTVFLGVGSIVYTEFIKADEAPTLSGVPTKPLTAPGPILKEDLIQHVDTLSRRIGERHAKTRENLDAARFYIESTLSVRNIGYPKVTPYTYAVNDETFTNLEVEVPGVTWPNEVIVVGAHYDTAINTPGADDNASGVAALLALAKAYVRHAQHRSIRFVAFVNEEPPWFQTQDMGSLRYARSLQDQWIQVYAMLSLESIGYYSDQPNSQNYPPALADQYPSTGNFLAFIGNLESKPLVDFTHASARQANRIPVEKGAFPLLISSIGWSDHWSFWQTGTPAIMVTGTALYRNPHYHRPSDTPDTLDFDRLHAATEAIRRVIRDLANASEGTSFR